MAIVQIDGFDTYNGVGANTGLASKYTVATTAGVVSLQAGRFGGQCVRTAQSTGVNGSVGVTRALPAAVSSFAHHFAMRRTAMPTNDAQVGADCVWEIGGATHVGFRVTILGAIEVYRFTSRIAGTLLGATAGGAIVLNTWHYMEWEIVIHDTTGSVKLWLDGVQVLNITGADTRNGAPTTVDSYFLGANPGGNSITKGSIDWDDAYFNDTNAHLGEMKVETLYPSADTAQKDFTPNAGANNFDRVNEALVDGDTTFVQASTVGNTDRYAMADLSTTPATIKAVQLSAYARKTDAASRSIALQIKSGATVSDGGNFALAASYAKFERILENDPATGVAWLAAAVNAVDAGPKVTV